jgi:hypothetical protein
MTANIGECLEPPGLARILTCPDCAGGADADGEQCRDCEGTGYQIWRACPQCGDPAFDYVNGRNEAAGMHCRLSCGLRWNAQHPGWLIQRAPA